MNSAHIIRANRPSHGLVALVRMSPNLPASFMTLDRYEDSMHPGEGSATT